MATPRKRARAPYGSGSVYQRSSDGMWVAIVEAGTNSKGVRRRIPVYAKTEAKVRAKKKAKEAEIATGGASTMNDRTTIATYSARWLEDIVKDVRPKTYSTNASAVRQWIIPTIGHVRLNALTARDVRAVEAAQVAAGRKPATRVRTQAVLVKMLRCAMADGARIHPGVFEVKRATIGDSGRRAMPIGDSLAMLQLIESEPDPSRWVGALLNGIRQGERLGMTVECLDFDNDLIHVLWQLQELPYRIPHDRTSGFRVPDDFEARQLVGRFHLVRPKTKKGWRTLPMTEWFRAAALARLEAMPRSPHGLLWGDELGQPRHPDDDRAEWYDLQARAGVAKADGEPYVVHEIRHTTVTLLKELGVPDEVIEKIVGQAKLVQDYNHADYMPEVRKAMEAMAERLQLRAPAVEAS